MGEGVGLAGGGVAFCWLDLFRYSLIFQSTEIQLKMVPVLIVSSGGCGGEKTMGLGSQVNQGAKPSVNRQPLQGDSSETA